MNMYQAIAMSPGNKARTANKDGETVVVQEYHQQGHYWGFHIWHLLRADETHETDVPLVDLEKTLTDVFAVRARKDAWVPIT